MSTVQTTNIKHAASASNNITLDSAGNVGMGTATPVSVAGFTTVTAFQAGGAQFNATSTNVRADFMASESAGEAIVRSFTNHPLAFRTNNTERMRITAAGNVGIGTSSPGALCHVNGANFGFRHTNGSVTLDAYADGTNSVCAANSAFFLGTTNSNPTLLVTNNTERMRIDGSGNVGIGTSSPGDPLVLERSLAGGNGPFLRIRNSAGPNVATFGPALILDNGKAGVSPCILTQSQDTNAFRIAQANSPFATFMQVTTGGDLQFNSGYGSVATAFGCRAWVNFNGTGTVAIRASGNVSSITDNNVGSYTVNFTTAMPDINYCAVFGGENISGVGNAILNGSGTRATGSLGLLLTDFANNVRDDDTLQVAIFR